jgi:uncharacterized RDD family membrane protein YckC
MTAGFFARFAAYVIDQVALVILAMALMMPALTLAGIASVTDSGLFGALSITAMIFVTPALILLQFLYFGWLWSNDGRSVGMRLTGIRVVDQSGSTVSFARAGLRGTLGYAISGFFMCLGFIWAAFDPYQEAWHDKIFATKVVKD